MLTTQDISLELQSGENIRTLTHELAEQLIKKSVPVAQTFDLADRMVLAMIRSMIAITNVCATQNVNERVNPFTPEQIVSIAKTRTASEGFARIYKLDREQCDRISQITADFFNMPSRFSTPTIFVISRSVYLFLRNEYGQLTVRVLPRL